MNNSLSIVYRIGRNQGQPRHNVGSEIYEETEERFWDWLQRTQKVLGDISIVRMTVLKRPIKGEIKNVG